MAFGYRDLELRSHNVKTWTSWLKPIVGDAIMRFG